MNNCTSVKDLSTPPTVSGNIAYLVGVTPEGDTVIMDRPMRPGVVVFTGTGYISADGSESAPFQLTHMQLANAELAYNAIAFIDSEGRFLKGSNPSGTELILKSKDGGVYWAAPAGGLPTSGSGFLSRTVAGEVSFTPLNGVQYVDIDGEPTAVADGSIGTIFTMKTVGGVPTPQWVTPSAGNIAQGSGVAGLEGIRVESIGQEQVNVIAPTLNLTDGTNEVVLTNVNVTADLSNPLGLGGLDVGAENSSTWYYLYVTSDGVGDVNVIISEDPDAPDLTATTHTYWAFVSVFRNDGDGNIVEYSQRGRKIQTVQTNLVSHGTSTTALTNVTPTNPWNTIVPPNVKTITGIVGGDGTAPAATIARTMVVASTTSGIGFQFVGSRENTGVISNFKFDAGCFFDIIIDDPTAPTIAWASNQNDNKRRLDVTGYTI
jgi:hypothetical protein